MIKIESWEQALDLLERNYDPKGYLKKEEQDYLQRYCPLCNMTDRVAEHHGCGDCLWWKYEGSECPDGYTTIRMFPGSFPEKAQKALERIKRWRENLKREK